MQQAKIPRRTGRPLSFDSDDALRQAMLTFWRHGYEGASIRDLTAAMGITAPSLYTAFGDKKQLFLDAVALYLAETEAVSQAVAAAPTAREAARLLLAGAVERFTGPDTPAGCLIASSAASGPVGSADVRAHLADIRGRTEAWFRVRIARDVDAELLLRGTDAAALALALVCTIQGLSALARDGRDRAALSSVARAVLDGWPPVADLS